MTEDPHQSNRPALDGKPRRPWIVWTSITVAVLALVYSGVWLIIAERTETLVQTWIAYWSGGPGVPGVIKHSGLKVEGFPFEIRVVLNQPHYSKIEPGRVIRARADRLSVVARVWAPARLEGTGEGAVIVEHSTGIKVTTRLTASSTTQRLDLDTSGRVHATALVALGLVAETVAGETVHPIGRAETGRFWLDLPKKDISRGEAGASPITVRGRVLLEAMRPGGTPPFGLTEPARLSATLALRGALGSTSMADLVDWRDAGGTIDVEELEVDWAPVSVQANATLALDVGLQPMGAGTAEIRGLSTIIERVEANGELQPDQASIARLMLAAFTRPASDGGAPAVQMPITVQNRDLSLGPFKLFRLPRAVW